MTQVSEAAQFGVVLVTASSKAEATTIAQALVESQLVACVSIFPVESIYTWQGTVHQEPEWQLVIKSVLSHFPAIETKVRALHSYAVPEIVALPIVTGSSPYLAWISEQTSGKQKNSPDEGL